jgi:hypothetical protein
MGASRLNRRAMEWGFPWTAAIHPMEIDPNGEATALCRACPQCGRCPGLSNCSRSEQGAHLREERSAAAVPASATAPRGLFLPMVSKTRPLHYPRRMAPASATLL